MRRAPAKRTYNEAIAPAEKAYEKALIAAEKAYDEAIAAAEKTYDEVIAPAKRTYNEAIAAAEKAYDEVIAPADRKYSNPGLLGRILLGRIKGHFRWVDLYSNDEEAAEVANNGERAVDPLPGELEN